MERRMAERKEFTKPLDFKVSTIESGTVPCRARAVDLSSYGLGMVSDSRLAQGSIVRIDLPLEDACITLPLFAEVVHVMPFQESFRTGLIFLR